MICRKIYISRLFVAMFVHVNGTRSRIVATKVKVRPSSGCQLKKEARARQTAISVYKKFRATFALFPFDWSKCISPMYNIHTYRHECYYTKRNALTETFAFFLYLPTYRRQLLPLSSQSSHYHTLQTAYSFVCPRVKNTLFHPWDVYACSVCVYIHARVAVGAALIAEIGIGRGGSVCLCVRARRSRVRERDDARELRALRK